MTNVINYEYIKRNCPHCNKSIEWDDYSNRRKTETIEEFTFYCIECDEEFIVDIEVERKKIIKEEIYVK